MCKRGERQTPQWKKVACDKVLGSVVWANQDGNGSVVLPWPAGVNRLDQTSDEPKGNHNESRRRIIGGEADEGVEQANLGEKRSC